MNRLLHCSVVLVAALGLNGCSFLRDSVWPSLSGSPPPVEETAPETGTAAETTQAAEDTRPAERIEAARATMDTVTESLRTLAARVPFHSDQFDRRRTALGDQAKKLTELGLLPGEEEVDRWNRLQTNLSRLTSDLDSLRDERSDVAADTALGAALLGDLRSIDPAELDEQDGQRHSLLVNDLETVLAALGQMDRSMLEAEDRWNKFLDAQGMRIAALEPPPLASDMPPPPQPATRPTEPQVTPPGPTPPRDSGDRFKGRQPLVTLNFADPNLDFEPRLRALVDRVRAQYPDIAFDVETLNAPPGQLGALVSLLRELGVPADVYSTPRVEGDPMIRIYPR